MPGWGTELGHGWVGGSGPGEPARSGLCVGSWSHFLQGDPSHGKCISGGLGTEPGRSRKSSCPGRSQVTRPPLNCAWCWREGGSSLSPGEGRLGSEAREEGEEKDCRTRASGARPQRSRAGCRGDGSPSTLGARGSWLRAGFRSGLLISSSWKAPHVTQAHSSPT